MRKWFASLIVLGLAAGAASAQTITSGGCDALEMFGYDDGGAENSWKVNAPTGAGDAFSVDFNGDIIGRSLAGIALSTNETGSGGALGWIARCGDASFDSSGATPDTGGAFAPNAITKVITPTGLPGVANGFCTNFQAYDLPDALIAGNTHAVMNFATGDSVAWLCSDQTTVAGRSYFTTNSYATTAIPFTLNWMMRAVVSPDTSANGGAFVINGVTAANIAQGDNVSLAFWSGCATQPTLYLQMLNVGANLIALPGFVLQTGLINGNVGPFPNAGVLCGPLPCEAPVGSSFTFSAFFADNCQLKKNGNPTIKLTNTASFTVLGSAACNPCLCFGTKDDGVLDGTIWKVQNPAGSADYFNVNLGNNTCASTAVSIEAASWDFCGTGPDWAEVGLYTTDLGTDPTGGTPVLPALSSVGGASASMAPGSAEWGFPATLYDIPDTGLASSTSYSIGVKWASGDSCTWIASDTNGTNDDTGSNCAVIPSTSSFFTADGFNTNGVLFSATNWMMRLNWTP
jgi:hypothetical protein